MSDTSAVASKAAPHDHAAHAAEEKKEPKLPILAPEIMKVTRLYELMILLDPNDASRTWDKLVEWITDVVAKRYSQHVLRIDKWADSRKLAYEINGMKRGTYMLVWFRALPKSVFEIDRDMRLDEKVIRHIIVQHEEEPPTVGMLADDFDQAPPRREGEDDMMMPREGE
jgi:small subunit ribosomal protein S6